MWGGKGGGDWFQMRRINGFASIFIILFTMYILQLNIPSNLQEIVGVQETVVRIHE